MTWKINPITGELYDDAVGAETAASILAKLLTVDGAGSLLDADLLDGQHASAFELADATIVKTGNASWIDLTDGGTTTLHSHTAGGGDISGTVVVGQLVAGVTNTKTITSAAIIPPAVNILTLTNAAAATLALNITSAKTLTLTAVDNYTLTIPATGTAALRSANTFTELQEIATAGGAASGLLIRSTSGYASFDYKVPGSAFGLQTGLYATGEGFFYNSDGGITFYTSPTFGASSATARITIPGSGDVNINSGLYIKSTGEVGIGAAVYFAKLAISYQAAFNTTTPGKTYYGIHFAGQSTNDYANGLTWNGGSSEAQAGIYVQGSSAYGTKMYFATTDSYATGSKTRLTIDHLGKVGINTITPDGILHALGVTSGITAIFDAGATTPGDILQLRNSSETVLTSFGSTGLLNVFAGIADGINIACQTTTGTKFGASDTAKISVYNATPIVRQNHIADATDAASAITQLNLLIAAVENFGILKTA